MKKRYLLTIFLIFILIIAASCGEKQNANTKNSPTTITLWHYYVSENQLAIENMIDKFNSTIGIEEGIIVEPVGMGTIMDLEKELTDSAKGVINSKPMPDIFSSYPDKATEIDELGLVADLNNYFTEEEKSLYVKDFLENGYTSDGRLLLLPIVKSTELLYINKTDYEEFLLSQNLDKDSVNLDTWEKIYDISKKFYNYTDSKTPDIPWDGMGFLGFDAVANFIVISNKQLGIDVIDGDNKCVNLNTKALKNIFDIFYPGHVLGYFDRIGKFRSDDVRTGDLIAYTGSSSSAAYFPTWIQKDNIKSDISLLAKSYPHFEQGQHYAVQQGAGMCIGKSTPEKEKAAATFLKWFTNSENSINFAMNTGYLPVQKISYENNDIDEVINSLNQGDASSQNVASVYDITFDQILNSRTYSAKPFYNSYSARIILENTLLDISNQGKDSCEGVKLGGKSEEEILEYLNIDKQFDEWIKNICTELEKKEIPYKID